MKNQKKNWNKIMLFFLLVLICIFILDEGFLRLLYYKTRKNVQANSIWVKSNDTILIFKNRPDYIKDGIKYTDENGILTPFKISKQKPANTFRIVLLGDSIGAALIYPYKDRYGSVIENLLNRTNKKNRNEVLNFAVNGDRFYQEARLLEKDAINFNPDLILIQYCLRDLGSAMTPLIWFSDTNPKLLSLALLTEKFIPKYGSVNYWKNKYNSPEWDSVIQGLQMIKQIANNKKIPVVIVIFPFFLKEGWNNYPIMFMHNKIADAAKKFNFYVLDLKDSYAKYKVEDLIFSKKDIYHPNQFGYKIAGEVTYNYLIKNNLIR